MGDARSKTFVPDIGGGRGLPDAGGGQLATAGGDLVQRIAGFGQETLTRKLVADAQTAGIKAGSAEELVLRSNFSLVGRAFNDKATQVYLARQQDDIRVQLDTFKTDFPGDTASFDQAVAGFRRGLLERVPPQLALLVQQDIDTQAALFRNDIVKQEQAALDEEREVELRTQLNATIRDLGKFARAGDAGGIEHTSAKAQMWLEAAQDLLTPEQEIAYREQIRFTVASQTAMGQFEALGAGADAALAFVDSQAKDLSEAEKREVFSMMTSDISKRNALRTTDDAGQRRLAQDNRDIAETELYDRVLRSNAGLTDDNGNPVSRPDMAEVNELVRRRQIDPEFARDIMEMLVQPESTVDDPGMVDAIERLTFQDPDRAKRLTEKGYANGRLTQRTTSRLRGNAMGEIDEAANDTRKQVFDLYTAAGPAAKVVAEDEAVVRNQVLQEFDRRVNNNEEPQKIYDNLAKRRRTLMKSSRQDPALFGVDPRGVIRGEDGFINIQASKERGRRLLRGGKLSEAEFDALARELKAQADRRTVIVEGG